MHKILALFLILATCLPACSDDLAVPSPRPGSDDPLPEPDPVKERTYLELVNNGLPTERPDDAYTYPFYPSMEEWKNYTLPELQDKLITDEKEVAGLSTLGLFYACWEYPLTDSLLKKEAYQERFDQLLGDLPAYRLFASRTDAGDCLLSIYKGIDELYRPLVDRPMILEVLLSQSVFLDGYSSEERKEIAVRCRDIEMERNVSSDSRTYDFDEVHSLLLARVMQADGYAPFMQRMQADTALEEFVRTGSGFERIDSEGSLYNNIIKDLANQYMQ